MKIYMIKFLLLIVPLSSMADDRCTNSSAYTVDKRCYVTDSQKLTKPYNSVVALLNNNNDVVCTGTVRTFEDHPYVYTAKHCVTVDNVNIGEYILVKTQNGKVFKATKNIIGSKDITKVENDRSGDWAIYTVPDEFKDVISTVLSDNGWNPESVYNARVIGYGALKIMSDQEILNFKQKYITYLQNSKITSNRTEPQYGWYQGGVDTQTSYGKSFVTYLESADNVYYKNIFDDGKKLKVSYCTFSGTGVPQGCQIWGGNSGCGVFDNNGNLMGMLTGYDAIVGGTQHSAASDVTKNVVFLH